MTWEMAWDTFIMDRRASAPEKDPVYTGVEILDRVVSGYALISNIPQVA
ncbi:hypothetical protein [Desulfobacter sp.]